MTDALKHRGPDDEGYLFFDCFENKTSFFYGPESTIRKGGEITSAKTFSKGIALGHRRLSIIDLTSAGHQPMAYDDNRLVMVFNGELYNYIEIRDYLRAKGYRFQTGTDTEVILASYREWGASCLDKFNGMWSFVILDADKKLLFGARDRFGVKPLYYYHQGGVFAFASEIKSLLKLPHLKRKINEPILYDYLVWAFSEHDCETFFHGISKIPHSNYFTFNLITGELQIKRYYKLNYNHALGVFNGEDYGRYCKKIRELFFRAVDIRLRSDARVGSCLSGGIDSSSIVVTINELLKYRHLAQVGEFQQVFTAGYEDSAVDEREYASAVVDKTNAAWFTVFPTARELLRDMERLVYVQDEPFASASVYAQYRVMHLAHQNGIKVLLDGQGGDELFTGYKPFYAAFYLDLTRNFRFRTLMKELDGLKNSPIAINELAGNFVKYMGARFLPLGLMNVRTDVLDKKKEYIRKDFFEAYRDRNRVAKKLACFSINEMCERLFDDKHLQALLRYEDRNSMANNIESRTPLSDDRDLIEYVFSIPSIYKIHNGWSKVLLRDAMGDMLPAKVRFRTSKLGFAVPERSWLAAIGPDLRQIFNENNDYIDTHRIARDFLIFLTPRNLPILWRYINFIMWSKVFDMK